MIEIIKYQEGINSAVILTAITKMNSRGFFDCQVAKRGAELMGVTIAPAIENQLDLLHCVHFKDMPPAVIDHLNSFFTELLK